MNNNLISKLYDLMSEGIYPSDIEGTCYFELTDFQVDNFAYISHCNNELSYSKEISGEPDVVVKMTSETLLYLFQNLEKFDFRDSKLREQVTMTGEVNLGYLLFNAIKRTPVEVQNHLKKVEDKSQNFKNDITEIKKVESPTKEEFLHLMESGVPFVVSGILDDWEFLKLSLPEIKRLYGKVKLRTTVKNNEVVKETTLSEFIGKMETIEDKVYTQGCSVPSVMCAKFKLPFLDWKHVSSPLMWMGTQTGDVPCTGLHRDCYSNMLTNILGRKKLVLYSPDQSEYVYPEGAFNIFQKCSVSNVYDVDLKKFPLFEKAKSLEVVIGPGESIVLPAFWYHCVYALDDVFSVGHGIHWNAWETQLVTEKN